MFGSIFKTLISPVAIMADHTIGTIAKPIAAITDNEKLDKLADKCLELDHFAKLDDDGDQ